MLKVLMVAITGLELLEIGAALAKQPKMEQMVAMAL
jgi:hypothetical protein